MGCSTSIPARSWCGCGTSSAALAAFPGAVVVSNAGEAAANGTYIPYDTFNGRTRAYTPGLGRSVYWDTEKWVLAVGATVMYSSSNDETNPAPYYWPWEVEAGATPAPDVALA